jgi:transglutaminase-like putative cysteine protease
MLYDINHTTTYRYDRRVFLEPHTVRLRPRASFAQLLERFELDIDPVPDGVTQFIDAQGNTVARTWFSGLTDHLSIRSRSLVHTMRANGFDFVLDEPATSLPLRLDDRTLPFVAPCLSRTAPAGGADAVAHFANQLADAADRHTLGFLGRLNRHLYETCRVIHREDGEPLAPTKTLADRVGACRDLTVLFIDACRAVNIPARFVSGYQEGDRDQDERHLHAWAEVFLPGAGWRGWDPTHGLAVTDRHIALAAAADARDTAPVAGSFRGTGAAAVMTSDLSLEAVTQPVT